MKRHLKKLLLRSRVAGMLASIGPRRAVILRYHSVQPVPGDVSNTIGEGITHSRAQFEQHMELIASNFNPVTIDDVVQWLQGERDLPKRAVAITFDDGFGDNWTIAAPILARYELAAAFYITVQSIGTKHYPWFCRLRHAFFSTSVPNWTAANTGMAYHIGDELGRLTGFRAAARSCAILTGGEQAAFLDSIESELDISELPNGSSLMMNWDQIVALQQAGHVIGSHTMTHPNVAHTAPDEVRHELQESKAILERRLVASIKHFSYPSPILEPHCSPETAQMLADSGYMSAVTCLPGPVGRQHIPLCLPRVPAPRDGNEFLWALEASLAGRVL